MSTFTRKQYLANECTHREYYGQFVTPRVMSAVVSFIGQDTIEKSTNKDGAFNDIPLRRWDALVVPFAEYGVARALREAGDIFSDATTVCVAKEAALQWWERRRKNISETP